MKGRFQVWSRVSSLFIDNIETSQLFGKNVSYSLYEFFLIERAL